MDRRSTVLLLLAAFGCPAEDVPATTTGLRLRVEYDSSLDPEAFAVFAVDETQAVIVERRTFDAPLFLEPPGLRTATIVVEVPISSVMDIDVRVDGVVGESVVGSGRASVTLESSKLVDATVRLGAPTRCGDGRVHPSLEECDDSNLTRGDGCSDFCFPEPGYTCRGAPSICVACGNGAVEFGETCDDGNRLDGDGCSSACIEEVDDLENVIEVSALDVFTSTTPEMIPIPGTTLTVPPSEIGGAWLVLVSGTLGSASDLETDAEIRVMIDGEETDRMGHQTLGAEDNDDGFMTFFVSRSEQPQVVHLELLASTERAWVKDVRLVAASIPAAADLRYYESDADTQVVGIDQTIDAFDIGVTSPGEYVFLAKTSVSEDPGDDTVQTWFVGPNGARYPESGWSNGRASLLPMFVAFTSRVDSDAKVSIQGTSSGVGDTAGWWNTSYLYRRPMNVEQNIAPGVSIAFDYNHANDVSAGRARQDGQDVRVVWHGVNNTFEVPRVVDPQSAWSGSPTMLWFRLPDAAADVGGSPYLYFGNSAAPAPMDDPNDVFVYFTAFDDLVGWSSVRGMAAVNQSGRLLVPPGSAVISEASYPGTAPLLFETRMRFQNPQPVGPANYWGLASPMLSGGADGRVAWFDVDPNAGHVVRIGLQESGWMPDTPDAFHRYSVGHTAMQGVPFRQDDFEIARFPAEGGTIVNALHMFFENGSEDTLVYDWARVRAFVEPAPQVQIGPLEGDVGVVRSTWRHRRIAAFRADAFDLVERSAMRDLVTTTSTFVEVAHTLDTETPIARSEYLVIQAARFGGASSSTARKSGVLTADGAPVLTTQHVINRGDGPTDGYHHVAGAAFRRVTNRAVTYANGVASPEGIRVSMAESNILVLRYAPP